MKAINFFEKPDKQVLTTRSFDLSSAGDGQHLDQWSPDGHLTYFLPKTPDTWRPIKASTLRNLVHYQVALDCYNGAWELLYDVVST